MKKSTKGALAAGGAAVLLMGGVGTLAYWSDSATITGTSISSGKLSITDDTCGSWILDKGVVGKEATYGTQLLVPGDSLTKVCTYKVNAAGAHLSATLTTPATAGATGTLTSAPTKSLPVTASYQVATAADGTGAVPADTTIDSTDDGKFLIATIKVGFPYGSTTVNGNDTQEKAATIGDIAISLVQDDNH
ncbi:hypothetical protein ASD11_05985 [Aeromicrobium sp. Root495]|uniref:alternate-type signal peptide domain-containing protein n=1 Tax=Aeromicrobium sp. Root495 TaxID=1736550 RepID=UPI0006F86897|nr:alternate-type signal peptide domain-containing protein [Aeromicrobium sp. Root495]KQY59139.1 hypothetical protein ASD11_05985 [Aeromicrobium sp. Root495]